MKMKMEESITHSHKEDERDVVTSKSTQKNRYLQENEKEGAVTTPTAYNSHQEAKKHYYRERRK